MSVTSKSSKMAKEACVFCGKSIAKPQMGNHFRGCSGKVDSSTKVSTERKGKQGRNAKDMSQIEDTLISIFNDNPNRQVSVSEMVTALHDVGLTNYDSTHLRSMVNDVIKRVKRHMNLCRVKRGVYMNKSQKNKSQRVSKQVTYEDVIEETPEMIRMERDMLRIEAAKLKEMLMRAIM